MHINSKDIKLCRCVLEGGEKGSGWKSSETEEDVVMNVEGRKEQVAAGWMSLSPSVVDVAMETAQSSGHGKHR